MDAVLPPKTFACHDPWPSRPSRVLALAPIESFEPPARTLRVALPSALENVTRPASADFWVNVLPAPSVTPEMSPVAESVTSTVRLGVPSNGSVTDIPPVWAIGAFVWAATAPGNAISASARAPLSAAAYRPFMGLLSAGPAEWHGGLR